MTTPLNSAAIEEDATTQPSQEKLDILEQLLKPEVQESLTTLVEQLPKLTEMITLLNSSYDFAKTVAHDDILKSDTVEFIKEIGTPVKNSVKNIAATAIEAKDIANESNEVIGLFGLLKMVKDPQAQKLFRFASAYLQLSADRENKN
jgi:uncharacterized protein YjgD (DUF1641 family)